MKLIFGIILLLSSNAFASIPGSEYEDRHQVLILKGIEANCGRLKNLVQLASVQRIIEVDQGIRDIEYVTTLRGTLKIDQGIFDSYLVTVKSERGDFYDHESQEHGFYSVSQVVCQQE